MQILVHLTKGENNRKIEQLFIQTRDQDAELKLDNHHGDGGRGEN